MIRRVALSEIVEINPRLSKGIKSGHSDRRVSFLPMSSVTEDGDLAEVQERAMGDLAKGYSCFERGDVLVAKITPCFENGKAVLLDHLPHSIGFGSTEFHVLRPSPEVFPRYLFYAVWNPAFRYIGARNMTGTAGQKRVPANFVKRFRIPLPSLAEQRRIAAILDKADAIRRKRREALGLLDELLRSAFLEMFGDPVTNPKGWEVVRLDALADIVSGVTKGRLLPEKDVVMVPYMRVANVQDGRIVLEDIKEIAATRREVTRYRLEMGDVLLTEGGDPDKLGRGAVWEGAIDPCIHQNYIFRVRVKDKRITPCYLSTLIGSSRGKRYFLRAAKQTTGIATINRTQLSRFPVLLPPPSLQKEYAVVVDRTARLSSEVKSANCGQDDLFNSLAQRAFRGKL